jgi:hypothetical protein
MTAAGGWPPIPPNDDPKEAHTDVATRLEQDALLVYRCCKIAHRMIVGGHLTTRRAQVVGMWARKAYVVSMWNLRDVQEGAGGIPLQLLASIDCPQYWQASRQLVWVMGEIGRHSPLAYNLRDQLKRALDRWEQYRREAAIAVYIDEQAMGGDHA